RLTVVHVGEDREEDSAPVEVDPAELDEAAARAQELFDAGRIEAAELMTVLNCRTYLAYIPLIGALPEPAPEGVARFERTLGDYRRRSEQHGPVHRHALARQLTADVAARQGRTAEAAAELRAAVDLLREAELPWLTPRPLGLLAQVALQQDGPTEAIPLL